MGSPVVGVRGAAVAASVLLLTACGGGSSPAKKAAATSTPAAEATRAPTDSDQLEQLLITRANALAVGDVDGFVATATGRQVVKDRRAIARANALPLADVAMTERTLEVNGDRATLQVNLIYAFDGIDTQYVKRSRMRARKSEDGWRFASDRPSAGELAPWEYKRYKARTSRHFLALAPANLKVGSLMKDLEKGRERMQDGLPGVKAPGRVLVIVARDGEDTKALTKNWHTLSALVAVAEAQVTTKGPARRVAAVASQRVFVLWRSFGDRSADERRMVIAHELTHLALARKTGGRVPAWLVEGTAMYASGDQRAGEAGALLSGGRLEDASKQGEAEHALSLKGALARPSALDRMSAIPLAVAYSYSSAAAYAIAQNHGGAKTLLRLYSAFNKKRFRGKPGRELSDKVFRKTLHSSLESIEEEVDAYARANSSL
ncbi:MAG TPA: hypothetical protein VFG79_05115 [Solirubrobacter sp.]|nr:hypothetical protein [Solirubrobacter sp.]